MNHSLIEQYKQLHAEPKVFAGMSCLANAYWIKRFLVICKSETLLDYGCGKGLQYEDPYSVQKWWGVMPTLYDPAVTEFAVPPSGLFDGVFCVDVLEHIEERDIPDTLDVLFSHARKFLFLTVCPRESSRSLPDGRNCHITIRRKDWWRNQVHSAATRCERRLGKVKLVVTQ